MKKMICLATVFSLLSFFAGVAAAADAKVPGNLYPSSPAGIIRTPPSTIPQRTSPDLIKPPVPPVTPPATGYRGAVDPKTGHFFPSQGNGVFNPRTGEFYPRSGSGFINPRTGAFYPGMERGGVPESPPTSRP
jgi:hypothetical protein